MGQKSIVMTGATGYIGSHLLRKLVRGGWNISVIVRPESNREHVNKLGNNVHVITYDYSLPTLVNELRAINPLLVVHIASNYVASHTIDDVDSLVQGNLLYSTHLLQAMLESGINKFVNTSSFTQHVKDSSYQPLSLYAATKQAFESIIEYYAQQRNFQVVTLELFDTYGPADSRSKFLNILLRAYQQDIELSSSLGYQKLDLVYIDDVISAYILAIELLIKESISGHKKFAVSSGNMYSLRDIVKMVEHLLDRSINIKWGARPYREHEIMEPWNQRDVLPNWRPYVSLDEGISRVMIGLGIDVKGLRK